MPQTPLRARIDLTLLFLLVLSEVVYLSMLRTDAINGSGPVLGFLAQLATLYAMYALIAWRVVKGRLNGIANLTVVIAAAVIFRLTLLPAGLPPADSWQAKAEAMRADLSGEAVTFERFLLYDHDIWRYLWDGRVSSSGINPYAHPPDDEALDSLEDGTWSEIRWNVNHSTLRTVYPPAAQALFFLAHRIAPGSILAMKSLLTLLDLAAIVFLALALRAVGRPPSLVVLYALNPLPIKVFAGSGHVDVLLVAASCAVVWLLATKRHMSAVIAFTVAVLTKISPLVLLPFVLVRLPVRLRIALLAMLGIGLLPMVLAWAGEGSGLRAFASGWEYNGAVYASMLAALGGPGAGAELAARMICVSFVLIVVNALMRRDEGSIMSFTSCSMWAMGALLLCSPAVFPWYVTWLLPFAVIRADAAWLSFSALVWLSLHVMIDGLQSSAVLLVEYGLLSSFLIFSAVQRRHAFVSVFQRHAQPKPRLIEENP